MGIGAGLAVPLLGGKMAHALRMPVDHGVLFVDDHTPEQTTSFWLRLAACEGTVIELVP